jgi:hypothetical protein
MPIFAADSRCECQATLTAIVDEKHHVIEGTARRHGDSETAPAHAINPSQERFDIGWLCPFCGRNTLRSFHHDALRKVARLAGANA